MELWRSSVQIFCEIIGNGIPLAYQNKVPQKNTMPSMPSMPSMHHHIDNLRNGLAGLQGLLAHQPGMVI